MKTTRRLLSLLMVLITLCGMIATPACAASIWPSFSPSSYCEMISPGKITVYRDSGLRTPGTCSPAKSYNAYVAKNDKIYILKVTRTYTKLSYPSAGIGRRIGFVKTSTLFGVTAPIETVTCKNKVTTYTGASTSSKSGSTAVGDTVLKLGSTKNGFILVMYDALSKSTSRSMKAAFVTLSDYNRIKGKIPASSTNTSAVKSRLDSIGNGSLRYNRNTVMKIGAKFTGTRSSSQCKGYAQNVFYLCFGIIPGSTQPKSRGLNYLINSTSGMTNLGSVTSMSSNNISALFAKARPGDFVQIRRVHGGSHSAIVYSVTSNGVTFLEANLDGKNTVYLRTYSWNDLCKKNSAMSVYTATNYNLKKL